MLKKLVIKELFTNLLPYNLTSHHIPSGWILPQTQPPPAPIFQDSTVQWALQTTPITHVPAVTTAQPELYIRPSFPVLRATFSTPPDPLALISVSRAQVNITTTTAIHSYFTFYYTLHNPITTSFTTPSRPQ